MDFPQTALVKKLDEEHPDFTKYKEAWKMIGLLYEGGVALQNAVIAGGAFLIQNSKELPDVFQTRQKRFSYTNLLGNVIGWYISALFKQPPEMYFRLEGVDGEEGTKIPQDAQDFSSDFEKDCNRGGQALNDFMHDAAECALLYKSAWVLIDLPSPNADTPPQTLLQQKQSGLLDPYLVMYEPLKVINWETDAYGNLVWVIIKIRVQDQEFLADPVITDYWYYFDRLEVALYERPVKQDSRGMASEDESATLADGYPRPHAMTAQGVVPIHRIVLPQGLWLANRVFLPLCNHLNLDNAFDFGLYQSNLPQLYITDGPAGVYEEPVTVSAVGYHHLPNGATMGFVEPAGNAYDASQERIANLEERIYKACYLMDQARTNRSTPTAQSGISKQQDKTPSRDALSGIGAVLQPSIDNIYRDLLTIAAFPEIEPECRGFDFSDKVTAEDMGLLEQATIVPMNSPTFERELAKRNVRLALPELEQETRTVIDSEIDSLPTPSEQQAQLQEQQRQDEITKFTASMQAGQKSLAQGQ